MSKVLYKLWSKEYNELDDSWRNRRSNFKRRIKNQKRTKDLEKLAEALEALKKLEKALA